MKGAVFDPLTEPVPQEWTELIAKVRLPAVWDADVLTALAWCAQHRTYLGLVTDAGGTPCAAFHVRHFAMSTNPSAFVRGIKRAPAIGLVECRLPPTYSIPGHVFLPDLETSDRSAALHAFERAMFDRLGARAVAIAYRVVLDDEVAAFDTRRHLCRPMSPDHVVDVVWPDLDAYLAGLPSHVRRRRRKIENDSTVRVRIESSLPALCANRLADGVRRAHRPGWWIAPPLPSRYFELLGDRRGINFVTYTSRDRLVAFGLVTDDETELTAVMWGAGDRNDHGRQHFYFDEYLRAVDYAITRGRRRVRTGKGAASVKQRFGARPVPAYLVMAVR